MHCHDQPKQRKNHGEEQKEDDDELRNEQHSNAASLSIFIALPLLKFSRHLCTHNLQTVALVGFASFSQRVCQLKRAEI